MKKIFLLWLDLFLVRFCLMHVIQRALICCPMDSNVAFLSVIEKDYAPLNTIPENVSSRMDQDELQFWKKMSTRFYINYSFVETEYYQRYKNSFIKRMENLYNNMKWDGEPSKLSFF